MIESPSFESMEGRIAGDKEILEPKRFFKDLKAEASHAKKIVLQAMAIEDTEAGNAVIDIFRNTPEGASKELYIDWWSRMVFADRIYAFDQHVPWLKEGAATLKKAKYKLFWHLKNAGVNIHFTNPPKKALGHLFPFTGRNHMKGADVDDGRVFYLGGVNFDHTESADFMVKCTGDIGKKLSESFTDIHAGRITKDESRPLDEHSVLYIDTGTPGQSIIMKKAADLIAQAHERIQSMSMLPPDGPIAQGFRAASRRGVRTEIIMSSAPSLEDKKPLGTETVMGVVKSVSHVRNTFSGSGFEVKKIPRFVHAKLLIVDQKYAYFGTHNLNESGVKAGTQEWGIFTSDPVLVQNLLKQYMTFRAEEIQHS